MLQKFKIWYYSQQLAALFWPTHLAWSFSGSPSTLGTGLSLPECETVQRGLMLDICRHMNGKHHINSGKEHLFKLLDFLLHDLRKSN